VEEIFAFWGESRRGRIRIRQRVSRYAPRKTISEKAAQAAQQRGPAMIWVRDPRTYNLVQSLVPAPRAIPPLPKYPQKPFDKDAGPKDPFIDLSHEELLTLMSYSVSEPASGSAQHEAVLPTDFIHKFIVNGFNKHFDLVDLAENPGGVGPALKSLDFLNMLESKRCSFLQQVAQSLTIHQRRFENIPEEQWDYMWPRNPKATAWLCDIRTQELEIGRYFAKIYVWLRIWVSGDPGC
jgi:hypothetical protein